MTEELYTMGSMERLGLGVAVKVSSSFSGVWVAEFALDAGSGFLLALKDGLEVTEWLTELIAALAMDRSSWLLIVVVLLLVTSFVMITYPFECALPVSSYSDCTSHSSIKSVRA